MDLQTIFSRTINFHHLKYLEIAKTQKNCSKKIKNTLHKSSRIILCKISFILYQKKNMQYKTFITNTKHQVRIPVRISHFQIAVEKRTNQICALTFLWLYLLKLNYKNFPSKKKPAINFNSKYNQPIRRENPTSGILGEAQRFY